MIYKTLHQRLCNTNPINYREVKSGALEYYMASAPQGAPVVLLLLHTRTKAMSLV